VVASAALPGLYAAVTIGGQPFVDGALIRTMHASLALEAGCELVICINPLVPFDAPVRPKAVMRISPMRTASNSRPDFSRPDHSRMQLGMAATTRASACQHAAARA